MLSDYNGANMTSYCQDHFTFSNYDEIKQSSFIKGIISFYDHQSKAEDYLLEQKTSSLDFLLSYLPSGIVMLCFVVVIAILWVFTCGIAHAHKKCCCCWKLNTQTYFPSESRLISGIIFVFGGLIGLAFLTAGIVYSWEIKESLKYTECSAITAIDQAINGAYDREEFPWQGIQPSLSQSLQIIDDFHDHHTSFNVYTAQYPKNLLDEVQAVSSYISQIYLLHKNDTFTNPIYSGTPSRIPTSFISKLGPMNKTNTITYNLAIEKSLNMDTFSGALYGMYEGSKQVSKNSQVINSTLDQVKSLLVSISGNFNNTETELISFISDNIDPYINTVTWCIFGALLFLGIWGFLMIVSALFMFYKGQHWLPAFIVATWHSFFVILIIGCLFMTAVFPVVVMLSDSCNVITETVTKSNIRKLDSLLGDTGIEVINECLFKDGNILMIDNLSTYLSFASKVLSGFDIIDTVTKSMLSNYPILTYYMNYGLCPEDIGAPYASNSLTSLNKYTDRNANGSAVVDCLKMNDKWVFTKEQCSDYHYITKNQGSVGTKSCLIVREWDATAVSNRYKFRNMACPADYTSPTTAILNHFQPLNLFVLQVYDKYILHQNSILDLLNSYNQKRKIMANTLSNQIQKGNVFFKVVGTLIKGIADPTTGIIPGLNCTVMRHFYDRTSSALCSSLISNIGNICTCLIFMNIFLGISIVGAVDFNRKRRVRLLLKRRMNSQVYDTVIGAEDNQGAEAPSSQEATNSVLDGEETSMPSAASRIN